MAQHILIYAGKKITFSERPFRRDFFQSYLQHNLIPSTTQGNTLLIYITLCYISGFFVCVFLNLGRWLFSIRVTHHFYSLCFSSHHRYPSTPLWSAPPRAHLATSPHTGRGTIWSVHSRSWTFLKPQQAWHRLKQYQEQVSENFLFLFLPGPQDQMETTFPGLHTVVTLCSYCVAHS